MEKTFQSNYPEDIYLRRDKEDYYSFFLEVKQTGEYEGERWERFLISAHLTLEELYDLFGPVDACLRPGERKRVRLQLTLINQDNPTDTSIDNS